MVVFPGLEIKRIKVLPYKLEFAWTSHGAFKAPTNTNVIPSPPGYTMPSVFP